MAGLFQALQGRGELGFESQSFVEFGDRLDDLPRSQAGVCQVKMGFAVIGQNTRGLPEMRHGFHHSFLPGQGRAQVVMGGGIVGHGFKRGLVLIDGLIQLSLAHEKIAQVIMGLGVVWHEPQRFEVMLFSLIELAISRQRDAKVEMHILVIGVGSQSFAKLQSRKTVFCETCKTSAISFASKPPKNFNSTTSLFRG